MPLLYNSIIAYPNLGTVIQFPPFIGTDECDALKPKHKLRPTINSWRFQHPESRVSIAYGVFMTAVDGKICSCGHNNGLKIQCGDLVRFYWFAPGISNWGDLRVPASVLYDWDEGKMRHQLHFPDLKWFVPAPTIQGASSTTMSREELIASAQRRLDC